MAGRLIAVVGPSGVGKDTVMEALAAEIPGLGCVRRVITRPEALGGEDFEGVSPEEFARQLHAGAFALAWQAHGLSYGIPARITEDLAAGQDLLVNLSRQVLSEAGAKFPGFLVLNLTARPEVRASRLANRGREDAAEIESRLARKVAPLPTDLPVITLDNSGALSETIAAARRLLAKETEAQ